LVHDTFCHNGIACWCLQTRYDIRVYKLWSSFWFAEDKRQHFIKPGLGYHQLRLLKPVSACSPSPHRVASQRTARTRKQSNCVIEARLERAFLRLYGLQLHRELLVKVRLWEEYKSTCRKSLQKEIVGTEYVCKWLFFMEIIYWHKHCYGVSNLIQ
jgi:hypothetical protein